MAKKLLILCSLAALFTVCQRNWKNPYDDPGFNTAPVADLRLYRADDGTERTFILDASGCIDKEDSTAHLLVRWDWDSDGTWDNDWTAVKTDTHIYTGGGQQEVRLIVRDRGELTDITIKKLGVAFTSAARLDSFTLVVTADASPCAFAAGDLVRWNTDGGTWSAWDSVLTDSFVFAQEGKGIIQLEVAGTGGFRQTYTETVTVDFYPGMKFIGGGSFDMGSDWENDPDNPARGLGIYTMEQPVHRVTVSPFRMDSTEVTQADYLALTGYNPSSFSTGPVEKVSWYDAVLYCNARSRRDGLDTVYSYRGICRNCAAAGGADTLGQVGIDYTVTGYRLPTEAEWEYACRGGTGTRYYFGDDGTAAGQYIWSVENSDFQAQPGASLLPNGYGLYDMGGNVWEWCNDWYHDSTYAQTDGATDPAGPGTGLQRTLHGGAFNASYTAARSASRSRNQPIARLNFNGFRCVLPARP